MVLQLHNWIRLTSLVPSVQRTGQAAGLTLILKMQITNLSTVDYSNSHL
ncbi:hypothetical protein EVA_07051 [gut metagenome]|uniref:Uncharacterized protein n=1 Tax=gut metagenome TaxID=749906 RepID=J9GBY6_9ZZZZ